MGLGEARGKKVFGFTVAPLSAQSPETALGWALEIADLGRNLRILKRGVWPGA